MKNAHLNQLTPTAVAHREIVARRNNSVGLSYAAAGHDSQSFYEIIDSALTLSEAQKNDVISVGFETYTGDYSATIVQLRSTGWWYAVSYYEVDDHKTPVIFRTYPDGTVIALFPALPSSVIDYSVTAYAHIGQRGGADYDLVIRSTKPSTQLESLPLSLELSHIGYNLQVVSRRTPAHRAEFSKAVVELMNLSVK